MSDQTFGQWLKQQREDRGLSLRDVERITNGKLSNAAISQLETGQTLNPGIMTILLLSAAYGLSDDDVLHRARAGNAPMPTPDFCPHCGQLMRPDLALNPQATAEGMGGRS